MLLPSPFRTLSKLNYSIFAAQSETQKINDFGFEFISNLIQIMVEMRSVWLPQILELKKCPLFRLIWVQLRSLIFALGFCYGMRINRDMHISRPGNLPSIMELYLC